MGFSPFSPPPSSVRDAVQLGKQYSNCTDGPNAQQTDKAQHLQVFEMKESSKGIITDDCKRVRIQQSAKKGQVSMQSCRPGVP